jgi:hypothetical protein
MSPGPIPPRAGEERDSGERTMGVGLTVMTTVAVGSKLIDVIREKSSLQDLYPPAA